MTRELTPANVAARNAKARAAWRTGTDPAPYALSAGEQDVLQKALVRSVKVVKPAKYRNVKTTEGDSKKESRRLFELKLMQRGGYISNLAWQVRYTLIPKQQMADGTHERAVTYTCDAQYIENGKLVVEDTKSEATRKLPAYIHKRKAMLQLFGIEIREV